MVLFHPYVGPLGENTEDFPNLLAFDGREGFELGHGGYNPGCTYRTHHGIHIFIGLWGLLGNAADAAR